MSYTYQFALIIGRFQPFHTVHQKLLALALSKAEQVIVALGSHRVAPNIKNPWTTEQREQMIRSCLVAADSARTHFVYIRDYLYNDNLWAAELQAKVHQLTGGAKRIALVGHKKDHSSYYLEGFPQWSFIEYTRREPLNATDIRESYFRGEMGWRKFVAAPIRKFMDEFAVTLNYKQLVEEQKFVDEYKQAWSVAPYSPIFVTVDAVVVKSGHVLVVRRRSLPGRGLLALPGGFVHPNETLERSALRELKEEAGIGLPAAELRKHIQATSVFDHPERSLRGRTITHGYYINLGAVGDLPSVKGGADSDKAFWLPLNDVFINEDKFFEDHVSIITHFINK
jgi:bifunctional NMN adenylyltransferase/nudix hydrolase